MSTNGDTARVALIADVPVDIWAVPAWAYTGTPSNPHKTKNQECRGFGEEATDISAAEASKGGCSIDTGITHCETARCRAIRYENCISISTGIDTKSVNAGSLKYHADASKIMNETATLSSYQA